MTPCYDWGGQCRIVTLVLLNATVDGLGVVLNTRLPVMTEDSLCLETHGIVAIYCG